MSTWPDRSIVLPSGRRLGDENYLTAERLEKILKDCNVPANGRFRFQPLAGEGRCEAAHRVTEETTVRTFDGRVVGVCIRCKEKIELPRGAGGFLGRLRGVVRGLTGDTALQKWTIEELIEASSDANRLAEELDEALAIIELAKVLLREKFQVEFEELAAL